MRTSVTYHLSHEFGPFGHMDQLHFKAYVPATETTEACGLNFEEFKRKTLRDEKQSSEVFVSHYRDKYANEDLPIWMLTEVIPFGTLSRITENLDDKQIQRKIARDFGLSQSQLISWLRCLCYIRNVCAHHGRLWNRPVSIKPELLPKWRAQGITRDRLYVVLLVMLHLMKEIAPNSGWKSRLQYHLLSNMEAPLGAMHFPDDWYLHEPWNLP